MYPILFSIGGFTLYSFSLLLVVSWSVWSFVFWKKLRKYAVSDERIFDLMFFTTIVAFLFSRLSFVVTHVDTFVDNWLKVGALWVAPGLSFYGALISGILTLFFLARAYKIRFGYILDSFVMSFSFASIVGLIGSFLDGTTVGTLSSLPWALPYVGHLSKRHPIQVYEILVYLLLICLLFILEKKSNKDHWQFGILAAWYFFGFAIMMFGVEFFKENDLYIHQLTIQQWILIAIFAESCGVLYIACGGRQKMRSVVVFIYQNTRRFVGNLYEKLPKKRTG